jgi:hypothetical protein
MHHCLEVKASVLPLLEHGIPAERSNRISCGAPEVLMDQCQFTSLKHENKRLEGWEFWQLYSTHFCCVYISVTQFCIP